MKMCKIFYFLTKFFFTKTDLNRNGSSTLSRSKQRSYATEIYYKNIDFNVLMHHEELPWACRDLDLFQNMFERFHFFMNISDVSFKA